MDQTLKDPKTKKNKNKKLSRQKNKV